MEIITKETRGVSGQSLQKSASRGHLKRLAHGVYVDAKEYASARVAEQYCARARAFLHTHPKLTAWGITAAALEGAPVLADTPLHFAGAQSAARSRQADCRFHQPLPDAPKISNRHAQMLFECAISSPLTDTLLAANHLMRTLFTEAPGNMSATRVIDEKTSESLIRTPLPPEGTRLPTRKKGDYRQLTLDSPGFLSAYEALRETTIASTKAELLWMDYAQLCVEYRAVRAIRKAVRAGLYFSDQMESPAEALLVARCAELGFAIPLLQVNILNPSDGKLLGRVDGLWPSAFVRAGIRFNDSAFGRVLSVRQAGDGKTVIVEFDGQSKYSEDYGEALEKERQRQNAINNLGYRFVRISWNDLLQPEQLRTIFDAAHVPKRRNRT